MPAPSLSILVVEDDKSIRYLLVELLRDEVYIVTAAINGREAIDKVRADHPDLIIMDLLLPELTGIQAIAILKNDPDIAGTPIIAVSAMQSLLADSRNLGPCTTMSKPFDLANLLNTIHGLLASDDIDQVAT